MASKKDIEPEGQSKQKGVGPDELAKQSAVEDDVEGHSMLISPTLGRDLHNSRIEDAQRSAKAKQHETDAKRIFRR
jgi:hypothetical protein